MIKGVSKQIIEIKCTNNEYFEKALLFINSSCCAVDDNILNEYANELAARLSCDETNAFGKKRSRSGQGVKNAVLSLALGAAAAAVVGFIAAYF